MFTLFDAVVCGDDQGVNKGKPNPDIFLRARDLLCENLKIEKIPSDACLVFEDAINGVEAAKRAGMHVIWVPDPNVTRYQQENPLRKPSETLNSLEEFKPEKYGLPSFDNESDDDELEAVSETATVVHIRRSGSITRNSQ